jgi:hypothetical protein
MVEDITEIRVVFFGVRYRGIGIKEDSQKPKIPEEEGRRREIEKLSGIEINNREISLHQKNIIAACEQ